MSNFFQSKSETKNAMPAAAAMPVEAARTVMATKSTPNESVSTLAAGMQITGNITCAGMVQIYGTVAGDIHVNGLAVCDGAHVEGKILAQDTVIQGKFNGTIHSNTVKLTRTAVVEGEIYSRSLMIEQDAQFEGVSRKLDKQVEAVGTKSAAVAAAVAAAPQPMMQPVAQPVAAAPAANNNGVAAPRVVN